MNGCSEAKAMLDRYTIALAHFHKAQAGLLTGMSPSHPRYAEVRGLKDRAFESLLRARKVYWDHVTDHKCRQPVAPTDLAYEKN
jgi:hypothetical protein